MIAILVFAGSGKPHQIRYSDTFCSCKQRERVDLLRDRLAEEQNRTKFLRSEVWMTVADLLTQPFGWYQLLAFPPCDPRCSDC